MPNHAQLSAGGIAMMSGVFVVVILAALLTLVLSQESETSQPLSRQRTLVIAVTPDFASVMERVGVSFIGARRGTGVKILHVAADAALQHVRRKRADLAVLIAPAQPLSPAWRQVPIARDGVSIVVHRSNPIAVLSDADIADLYTGRIKNWKLVGGEDMPVAVRKKNAGHLETEQFMRYLNLENAGRRADLAQGDSEKLIRQVADNPEAFGISSVAVALRQMRMGHPIKLLALREVPASEREIRSGRFPLVITALLVSVEIPSPLADEFIAYTQSGAARELFRSYSLIEP